MIGLAAAYHESIRDLPAGTKPPPTSLDVLAVLRRHDPDATRSDVIDGCASQSLPLADHAVTERL